MGKTDWDIINGVYKRDAPRYESNGWIQWKGTDVCIDLDCVCGQSGHVDGDFMYCLECKNCGRKYYAGCNIKLIELTPEESAQTFHDPYFIQDQDETVEASNSDTDAHPKEANLDKEKS